MDSASSVKKTLQADKKNRIIERFLREKYKAAFRPEWLATPANYQELGKALDFLFQLDDDNLGITAIGSDNETTRATYKGHFDKLVPLLDKFVPFSDATPPVALAFNDKEAALAGIQIKQGFAPVSLRDLHAQNSNLGVAEKFLNDSLGPQEWLSDVDLERALTRLQVRDRVHITRLNAADIGMVLHFERVKHGASQAPYAIPLMINCGSNGTGQGSHWTEALVQVNPATGRIRIDYRDSMPIPPGVRDTLAAAVHYDETSNVNHVVRQYTAFPGVVGDENLVINTVSDNSQLDNWSCGYRSLHNLLSHGSFPTAGLNVGAPPWSTFVAAQYASAPLRNAIYGLLLQDLQINEDFFAAMQLEKGAFKPKSSGDESSSSGQEYGLDEEFARRYMEMLASPQPAKSTITTNHFDKEYKAIAAAFGALTFTTDRVKDLARLKASVAKVTGDETLSSDAKAFALLDALAMEYHTIVSSIGGDNSKLGKAIQAFCEKQFGVTLSKGPNYQFKEGSLMLAMLSKLGAKPSTRSEETVLPSSRATTPGPISLSTPLTSSVKKVTPKVSPSEGSLRSEEDPTQQHLLKKQALSRVGTMFGKQFCYGDKPGGVEPGFRAIDLTEEFFEELQKIIPPSEMTGPGIEAYKALLVDINKAPSLLQKQVLFSTFVNAATPRPHAAEALSPTIAWLCEGIKGAIKKNERLSAWMYKLDYAETGASKKRPTANQEALREFVGTRLAGIFSNQNQRQEIAWIAGPTGPHALLACGWKNGLQELRVFLHGGGEPDYNGVLVDDPKAPIKHARHVPGLGKNLIFGVAIGDRDGIGKDGQNKGYADRAFYGFDYGKPYEGSGIGGSLRDDFTFTNPGGSLPAVFRGSGALGQARHIMYRNYSVFYDTELSERLIGVHILKKMITGENPSEEVIQSYPGLRHELNRIQARTPSSERLLHRAGEIRSQCGESHPARQLLDNLSMKISTGRLRTFDLYFTEMKLDLIAAALETGMTNEELTGHMKLLDEWALKATVTNQQILTVFESRLLLTSDQVNFLDKIEKCLSPASAVSHDGQAILNHLRILSPGVRIPFQLTQEKNGTFTLKTDIKESERERVSADLKKLFGIDCKVTKDGLSCNLPADKLAVLMAAVDKQYEARREELLVKPMFELQTLPALRASYQVQTLPKLQALLKNADDIELSGTIRPLARKDNLLSMQLIAKTDEQAKLLQALFELPSTPKLNTPIEVTIPNEQLLARQNAINLAYQKQFGTVVAMPTSSKWGELHASAESTVTIEDSPAQTLAKRLVNRYEEFTTIDEDVMKLLRTAIGDMTLEDLVKLDKQSDATLKNKANITHIINDELAKITVIEPQEVELQSVRQAPGQDHDPGADHNALL